MSNKTRSTLKLIAVIIALVAVFMELGFLSIAGLGVYKFWLMVIAFGLVIISSK